MATHHLDKLRYPIGAYEPKPYSEALKEEWIADIRFFPQALEAALQNLDAAQLHTPYRPGGWTIHQLVHHLADSHMNAYVRCKLAYTQDTPTICPYDEDVWVKLADVAALPVNISVTLLHALHQRWSRFLESFSESGWNKHFNHPEHNRTFSLWYLPGMYSWHGRHHVAHITSFRERMGF